ncbi:unnamed protein product, partial [Durusdinium trenchii]
DLVGFVKASKPLRGDHETRAVHLKVFMDKLHLREPLEGVHVVAKLSPEQEVLARPVTDEGGMGRIGLTAVAEEPAWRLDELKQVVFGPWPEMLGDPKSGVNTELCGVWAMWSCRLGVGGIR